MSYAASRFLFYRPHGCTLTRNEFKSRIASRFPLPSNAFVYRETSVHSVLYPGCGVGVCTYMECMLHAHVEHRDWRKHAGVQTTLHLFQGLGKEAALHQALNITEIHHGDLHRTTEREKRQAGNERGRRTAGSARRCQSHRLKQCSKAHSDQEAENTDTGVSLMDMPITKLPIKAPCLKSGDLDIMYPSQKGSD